MKVFIVVKIDDFEYIGIKSTCNEASALLRSKFPNSIEVAYNRYICNGETYLIIEDELLL